MRTPHRQQLQLDCQPISSLKLNSKCRDRIVPILRALQHIYQQPKLRERVLALIAIDVLGDANPNRGREGMTLWQILVLASVRLGCNFTYDQLQDLAENHQSLMCLMQVRGWQEEVFTWKRIRDNICCVRPETIEKINHLIVAEGHGLEPSAAEAVRGDAFVAETNIHYPTESSLILDGLEKLLKLAPELSSFIGFAGWRQHQSLWKKAKQAARQIGRLKKGPNFQARLNTGYQKLFHIADLVLSRTQAMLDDAMENLAVYQDPSLRVLLEELAYWHSATEHVRGTAHRRVVEGERVPNSQKLFSLHEPDTELIKRGKARQPVEFEDRYELPIEADPQPSRDYGVGERASEMHPLGKDLLILGDHHKVGAIYLCPLNIQLPVADQQSKEPTRGLHLDPFPPSHQIVLRPGIFGHL